MRKLMLVLAVLALGSIPAVASGQGTAVKTLKASLTGAAEVPNLGAPGASGKVTLTLNTVSGRVCWTFSALKRLGGTPNAAHIHRGRAGVAGGVVVPLGAAYRRQGCTTATVSLVNQILANPGRYYVNLHNASYPGGTARGQLKRP
jgi:hypothetical protein